MSSSASGASSGKPVRLLSIDGGGVRGLSALVLLEQLMDLSNDHRGKQGLPTLEPWQMFDMIGGTSTGGLIAIMLGRLRLSISECKRAYMDLSEKAFTPRNFISRQIGAATVGSKFKTEPLENAIKSLIGDNWKNELLKDDDSACKVFVVSHQQNYTTPVVLRSYRNFRKPKTTLEIMRIWEACRATSAALTFFDPITIDGSKYSDGGLFYNNPVQLVHGEASEVFPNQEQVIVSLGTGMGKPKVFEPYLFNVAQLLADLATETERTANDFYRRDDCKAAKAGQYYRFNVPDIGDVGLEEVQRLGDIKNLTEIYLEGAELGQKINSCAKQLIGVRKQSHSEIKEDRASTEPVAISRPCSISVVSRQLDKLDTFVCGKDGHIYTAWWTDGRSWGPNRDNWKSLDGTFTPGAKITAISRYAEHLDLFICHTDSCVRTAWWCGQEWSPLGALITNDFSWRQFIPFPLGCWEKIGSGFPSGADVAAVSPNRDQINLFICGRDGKVYTSWFANGEWQSKEVWVETGSRTFRSGSSLTAILRPPGHIELFAYDVPNGICTASWNIEANKLSEWQSLGSPLQEDISAAKGTVAVARRDDCLNLFVCGKDGKVYTRCWVPSRGLREGEGVWEPLGGLAGESHERFLSGAQVTAVTRHPGELAIFVCDASGCVYTKHWRKGHSWSETWLSLGRPSEGFIPEGADVTAETRSRDGVIDLFVCRVGAQDSTFWWKTWDPLALATERQDDWHKIGRQRLSD